MIILEDVTKTYSSGVPALNGINLHVQKGEFVFIVGKSGSGKSKKRTITMSEGKIISDLEKGGYFYED